MLSLTRSVPPFRRQKAMAQARVPVAAKLAAPAAGRCCSTVRAGQLSKSKLTSPSCSFRRALKGWPDFDLNPLRTEVAPSRSSAFAVRLEIRLPDIVFQIVKLQPSRQRLQLNDFFCSTTCDPQSGHGPRPVADFSSVG
jgi:hypothetical protein